MKIESFQKLKNGMYKIKLENTNEFTIYEDLILKYDLLIHKKVTTELLKILEEENKKQEGYYSALKYLKTKRRSHKEIIEYLKKHEYSAETIEFTLNKLESQGYVSDSEYASIFLQEQLLLTLNGPGKVKEELRKKGISEEIIDIVIEDYSKDDMITKINKIINKKIKSNHNKSNHILKQKIRNDLVNQGFPISIINEEINKVSFVEDDTLRQKEQEKLYQKLKKKYSGKELEYKLKQKMYEKGFYYDE